MYRIVLALLLFTSLYSCENNMATVNEYVPDNTPLLVEKNATIYYSDSARQKLKLTAPLIESYGGEDAKDVFRKGINVDFFNDSMHVTSHVNADSAIMHNARNKKIMEADNHVVVRNRKGEKLETEQLFWDENKHILYTNKYVTITTATQILNGDGLTSNEDFSDYKITNLHGVVTLNSSK